MNTCPWPYGNGQSLDFKVYSLNTVWNKVAGLYVFAYVKAGFWQPLYIGQTDDFSLRMPNHERIAEAVKRGATHIHASVVSLASQRDTTEKLLIARHQPPMNEQHIGLGLLRSAA